MSEQPQEPPTSVVVQAEAEPAPVTEETALAAGEALAESGHASEAAQNALQTADLAAEAATQARADAAAAEAEAETASAAALTAEQKIDRLIEMTQPLYEDYASRRAAEQAAATQAEAVNEIDATGNGESGGTAGTGIPDSGSSGDSGSTAGETSSPRRGLRRGRR